MHTRSVYTCIHMNVHKYSLSALRSGYIATGLMGAVEVWNPVNHTCIAHLELPSSRYVCLCTHVRDLKMLV